MRPDRLTSIADEYMASTLTPSFTPDARARLNSFLADAATRVDGDDRVQVARAEAETRMLTERLGRTARGGAVDVTIVQIEIRGLCPIWPFCQ